MRQGETVLTIREFCHHLNWLAKLVHRFGEWLDSEI